MLRKYLKIIGSFFLFVVVPLVCAGVWFGLNASKYEEIAKPYLDKNMPIVTSWDFEQLKPLLTPEALKSFETERGQKTYKMFSKLGRLKSFDEPKYLSAKTGVSVGDDAYDVLNFTMLGHFDTGDALFTITLAKDNESYLINHININSDAFM